MITRSLVALVALLLAACGSIGPQPSTEPTASATPPTSPPPSSVPPTATAPPTITPGPTITPEPTTPPRTMPPTRPPHPTPTPTPAPSGLMVVTVLPAEHPVEVRPAIPGERICFLVLVDDRYLDDGPITIAARGEGVTVDSVPASVPPPGHVAELWVTVEPYAGDGEKIASVEVTVAHGGNEPAEWIETRSILVVPETDSRGPIAEGYFDFWIGWLAAEHPELGITEATEWESTFVSMLWIVSKYAYWSDEWEMVVAWHEMVPPDDFIEVYLRRRSDELRYSLVFRQDSFSANSAPRQINPPDELIR